MKTKIVKWLEQNLNKSKLSLEQANSRQNCPTQQIIDLNDKIRMLTCLIDTVNKFYAERVK